MTKLVRYSTIRFIPYADTQEFVNVGIIIHAPKCGMLLFKLPEIQSKRVSQFFENIDHELYKNAAKMVITDLKRIQNLISGMDDKELAALMDEVTKPKEASLTYSESSALLTKEPLKIVLDDLFNKYVR